MEGWGDPALYFYSLIFYKSMNKVYIWTDNVWFIKCVRFVTRRDDG